MGLIPTCWIGNLLGFLFKRWWCLVAVGADISRGVGHLDMQWRKLWEFVFNASQLAQLLDLCCSDQAVLKFDESWRAEKARRRSASHFQELLQSRPRQWVNKASPPKTPLKRVFGVSKEKDFFVKLFISLHSYHTTPNFFYEGVLKSYRAPLKRINFNRNNCRIKERGIVSRGRWSGCSL